MKKLKVVEYINKETGEVFDASKIIARQEIVDINCDYRSIKGTNDFMNENLGYYFHLLYGDILNMDLEPQMMVRFLYLCSYMNYENVLVTGDTKGQVKVKESELQEILRLSERETRNTKKYLLENDLIVINEDKTIKVYDEVVKRGKLKGDIRSMGVTRVFNDGIKELYEGVKPTQHKKLAVFIKLLPYVNLKYNVVSENMLSNNFDESEPLTSKDIAEICDYEKPARLMKELLSLKINGMFAIVKVVRGDRDFIVVNPRIYYKGNDIESLKYIMNFFDVK